MRKLLYVLLVLILAVGVKELNSQSVQTIGEGTEGTNYPPNSRYFNYAYCSMIFTSSELGDAKTITKIAFDQTVDWDGYWEYALVQDQKIYIKQTTDTEFGTTAYEDPEYSANGYTLLFDGDIQFNLNWTELILDVPFDYDGTSNLIIHWENHRGPSSPTNVNVQFLSSTISGNLCKTAYADDAFPTSSGTYDQNRPNVQLTYNSTGPGTPLYPDPLNSSIKVDLETDLEFTIGDNTTSYDVKFGTVNPPVDLIVTNAFVSAIGVYSVNPAQISGELLDPNTDYYWQVIAKSGGETSESEVWTFNTQDLIELPYIQTWEDSIINNFLADETDWSWQTVGAPNWGTINYDSHNHVTFPGSPRMSIACNVWGVYYDTYPLTSPRINIEQPSRVVYWWKQDGYTGGPSTATYFEISEDGGISWDRLITHSPESAMSDFEQEIIDISAYSGDNVYIRWVYETFEEYQSDYFKFDDLTIEAIPSAAIGQIEDQSIEFSELCVDGTTTLMFEIKNMGGELMNITGYNVSGPFTCIYPENIAEGETGEVYVTISPTTEGYYNETLVLEGNFSGDNSVVLSCNVYNKLDDFFENFDINTEIPEHWNIIRTNDPNDQFTNVTVKSSSYDAYSQPNAAKMLKMNDLESALIFIAPGTMNFDNNVLKFYARTSHPDYELDLQVGILDDPYNHESFEMVEQFHLTSDYMLCEVNFDPSNTKPYIGLSYIGGEYAQSIWIDDFSWENSVNPVPPNCAVNILPVNNDSEVDIMMGLSLKWTSGGGSPNGYKFSFGTDPGASNLFNDVNLYTEIEYSFLEDILDYDTEYFWKVTAYNENGDAQTCDIWNFTTMEDPTISAFPHFENFDEVDYTTDFDYPLGWSFANSNNDNFTWDIISNTVDPTLAYSAPYSMHMLFSLSTMDDWLFTSPMQMQDDKEYKLTFMYRTVGDQYVPNPEEKLEVLVGDNNNVLSMDIETIFDNQSITNQDWQSGTAIFTPDENDVYYFGFHAFSIPNQGLLLIDDIKVEESDITKVEAGFNNRISIYPNPAKEYLIVNNSEVGSVIEIIDISGKTVLSTTIKETSMRIDLSNIETGIFLIKFKTCDYITIKKFIKL